MIKVTSKKELLIATNSENGISIRYPKSVFLKDNNSYKYKNEFYHTFYSFFFPGLPLDVNNLDISPEAQELIDNICETNRDLS